MVKSALEKLVDDLISQVAEIKAHLESPKEKPSSNRFKKPDLGDIILEAARIGLPASEAAAFFNYYEANGWKVGRNPMKNWKAALANWKRNYRPAAAKAESTWELTQRLNIIQEEMSQLKSFGGMTDAFGFRWTDEEKRKRYAQLKVDRDELKSKIAKT